jgi:hypothetical protein
MADRKARQAVIEKASEQVANGITIRRTGFAKVRPAQRDADGRCIDWACTRMGSDVSKGDRGRCAGYHCPHCDTPTGMMGHRCPLNPDPDGFGCVAVQGPDEAETVELTQVSEARQGEK